MDSEPVPGNPPSPSPAKDHGRRMSVAGRDHRASDLRYEFEAFYRFALPRLMAYLMYLGARREEAGECAQMALVEALQRWEGIDKPHAWCRQVARREYYRRRYDAEESFDEVPADATPILSARNDGHDVAIAEVCQIVPLLQQLPPLQRQVMALWLSGAKPSEIAEEMGATPEQVRSNLRHAKETLRRIEKRDRAQEGGW